MPGHDAGHVVTEVLSGHVDIGVSTDATLQPQPGLEIGRFAPLRVPWPAGRDTR